MRFGMLPLLLALLVPVGAAHAGLGVEKTRVIVDGPDGQASLRLWNASATLPVLLQAWIDDGSDAAPQLQVAPFVIDRPLQRLNAGSNRDLQIRGVGGGALPQDRESLYWLNILDMGPKGKGDAGEVQTSVQWRIKLLSRPANLPGSAEAAAKALHWRVERDGDKVVLAARNESAFFVNLVKLQVGKETVEFTASSGIVRPYTDFRVEVPERLSAGKATEVVATWADDKGEDQVATQVLSR